LANYATILLEHKAKGIGIFGRTLQCRRFFEVLMNFAQQAGIEHNMKMSTEK
jgi:hypothetical protein